MHLTHCPHCGESLPRVYDAYCPYCRDALSTQPRSEKSTSVTPPPKPPSGRDVFDIPTGAAASPATPANRRLWQFNELPRCCPNCHMSFNEALYRRLFPRRYRWRTIVFVVAVSAVSWLALGWFSLLLIAPLCGWAMTWPKTVRVHCTGCQWSQNYLVSSGALPR